MFECQFLVMQMIDQFCVCVPLKQQSKARTVLYDNHVVCSPSDMLDGFVEKVFYVVVVVTLFMGQVVKTFLQFAP